MNRNSTLLPSEIMVLVHRDNTLVVAAATRYCRNHRAHQIQIIVELECKVNCPCKECLSFQKAPYYLQQK